MTQSRVPDNRVLFYLINLALILLCIEIALWFPDIDQKNMIKKSVLSDIIVHRSILTHNALIPVLLYAFTFWRKHIIARLYPMATGAAVAVSLAYDLFPKSWRGYAMIHVPVRGRTSELFSQLWLVLSIVICLYIVALSIQRAPEIVIAIAALILVFGYYGTEKKKPHETPQRPAITLVASTAVTMVLPTDIRKSAGQAYRKAYVYWRNQGKAA